ncbi:MAG: winged helix-turn-helix transcriptional regulator [Methanocella sp.]
MNKPVIYAGVIVLLAAVGIALFALSAPDGTDSGNVSVNATNQTAMTAAAPKTVEDGPWNLSGPGPVWKLYTAEDGTLYSFQGTYGNTIRVISPNGSIKWEYEVPGEWRVSNMMYRQVQRGSFLYPGVICPAFSIDNGTLYLYVRENTTTDFNHNRDEEHPGYNQYRDYLLKEKVMAINNGQLLWEVPISSEHHSYEDSNVYAQNDRVYVFDDYSVKVFSDNGTMLFHIDNASSPPAVDESGNIFIVPGIESRDAWINIYYSIYQYAFVKVPSNVVEAYTPDGVLIWQKDIGSPIVQPRVTEDLLYRYDMLPLYRNHTLYAPTGNGIMALGTDGSVKWSKKYEYAIELISTIPFDENGNVYFRGGKSPSEFGRSLLHIISPDGGERINALTVNMLNGGVNGDTRGGEIYGIQDSMEFPPVFPENGSQPYTVSGLYLTSYDLQNGTMILKQKIDQNQTSVILNRENYQRLLSLDVSTDQNTGGTEIIKSGIVRTTSDTIYVYYLDISYDLPITWGESHCNYSSALCAFDKASGESLWQKSLDTIVTSMETVDDTLYYSTRDGKIFGGISRDKPEPAPVAAAVRDDMGKVAGAVAGGTALTAAAVLFIKMFALGGLTRARGQLTKNDNRNRVMEFIASCPGSTLHEISRELGINVGTIRYHLVVLSLNHRVATFKSDGKYVRYFTNAGSCSKDEQFYLSLVRRDPIRKILDLLLDRAELSNQEISEALEMHESAISRYMKELAARGLVAKKVAGGRTAYSIRHEYRDPVAAALERLGND